MSGRHRVAGLLVTMVLVLVVLTVLTWTLQRKLIYFPGLRPPPVEHLLTDGEAVTLTTDDGLELEAWFVPSGATAVLVLPGNADNRAHRAPLARALTDTGLSVLLVDYRGYGGNPGRPSEEGLRSDARAAVAWLEEHPDVDRIVYFGESLGTALAAWMATKRAPAALVLRSPFPSLGAVARRHYGPVPDWFLRDRFRAIKHVRALDVPLLVVAGEQDEVVPVDLSRHLHAVAQEPKRFVSVPTAGHNDPILLDGDPFIHALTSFLQEHGVLGSGGAE
ncbi:MAG: alpha/beta hydrolase [Actinomycetota bacterium]|nr:alpha/beta hydrolase [Actinomycetota bacterium]